MLFKKRAETHGQDESFPSLNMSGSNPIIVNSHSIVSCALQTVYLIDRDSNTCSYKQESIPYHSTTRVAFLNDLTHYVLLLVFKRSLQIPVK